MYKWLILSLFLTGCAVQKSGQDSAQSNPDAEDGVELAQDDSGFECKMETHVGSKIVKRVCTTAAERQTALDSSQSALRRRQDNIRTMGK